MMNANEQTIYIKFEFELSLLKYIKWIKYIKRHPKLNNFLLNNFQNFLINQNFNNLYQFNYMSIVLRGETMNNKMKIDNHHHNNKIIVLNHLKNHNNQIINLICQCKIKAVRI